MCAGTRVPRLHSATVPKGQPFTCGHPHTSWQHPPGLPRRAPNARRACELSAPLTRLVSLEFVALCSVTSREEPEMTVAPVQKPSLPSLMV